MLTSDAPSVIIYVLLRLFQLFVKVIREKNNGNTDLVCSILRDFARNWSEFYEALGFYFEPYCDEINKTKDFKISGEHITKEKKYVIRIEYFYPADEKTTGSMDKNLSKMPTGNLGQLELSKKRELVDKTNDFSVKKIIQNGITHFSPTQIVLPLAYKCLSLCRYSQSQKNVRAIEQAREGPTIEKMAPETDAKDESDSSNGTRDDGTRSADIGSGREDPKTDEEEIFDNHPGETNNFGDHQCPPPQKNVYSIQHAPEEPIEKIAPETDAKSGSGSQNGTKEDGPKDANTENGTEDLTTDKEEIFENHQEETYEPPTSTEPANFSMDSKTIPNHAPEVSDGKNTKIEASKGMIDNAHNASERSISVEIIPEQNQNEDVDNEIYKPTTSTTSTKSNALFDNFLKDMDTLNPSQPEPTRDSSQDETMNLVGEEFQQLTYEVSTIQDQARKTVIDLDTKRDELEERSSILYTPSEEDHDEDAGSETFRDKLEEQKRSHKEQLDRKRQERAEKQRKLNEELQEIRRLQKQTFAMLLQCIQWRDRFQEKEAEWSDWIEHCYRRLIATVITQFTDFQDELGLSEKAFLKVLKGSPETVQSEVTNLCQKMEATLHKLSRIFENLAKIAEKFEDTLFIRILQKSSCDISTKLISVLNFLDPVGYSIEWYKELTTKFGCIKTSDVPGVNTLKKLCKEDNWDGLRNMEFPKWKPRSHVNIEELSSDEDEDAVGDKPENPVEVEKLEVSDNNDSSVEFSVMTYTEISNRTRTEDSEQARQLVEKLTECDSSIPTIGQLDEVEYFSYIDTNVKNTAHSQHDDAEEIKILVDEPIGKVEATQSSFQEKSEQDMFQGAICKQRTSEETAPKAESEEFSRDGDVDVVEDTPKNSIEVAKADMLDNNDSSNEVPDKKLFMEFLETWKDMIYPEDSKAVSNSDRTETEDSERADQVVRSVPTSVELDEAKNIAYTDTNAKNTARSQHDDGEEIKILVDELIGKVEASQSPSQKKSEPDGFPKAICKQKTAPIADIEEWSSDEHEDDVKDKPENLVEVGKVFESIDSSNESTESAQGTPKEYIETLKASFNSNRTEAEDLQQAKPDIKKLTDVDCFIQEGVELEKEDNCAHIDKNAKNTAHSQHDDKEEIKIPVNEASQSSFQEKSEQDKSQEAKPEVIRMQIPNQKLSKVLDGTVKCSFECKKRAVDLEDPSIPNNRTGKCSDEEDIKILMEEITVRVSSNMDDNFENQINEKKLLMLYDHLLRQRLTWDRSHPMKVTYSPRVKDKYPPQLVRIWNELVKKETKFLARQQIIELIRTKSS